jgi:hypothetical protein
MRNTMIVMTTVLAGVAACHGGDDAVDAPTVDHFSFFVTSVRALRELSGNALGFGGDLRFGETGAGAGLRGADKICAAIAERSMPGASAKPWRAFLSASDDGTGHVVNAIDRIGSGPWYDRRDRVFALSIAGLLSDRPQGGDASIADDFPNEDGLPNHDPDLTGEVDNHDMLTGTNDRGQLYANASTCLDWTSSAGDVALTGRPRVGHSWPGRPGAIDGDGGIIMPPDDGGPPPPPDDGGMMMPPGDGGFMQGSGNNWMSALDESGCAPGINLLETGGPDPNSNTVGSGGGYGGFYCFSLEP